MTIYRKRKMPTLAQIRRNPPPGARGYKDRRDQAKRKPSTDKGSR